MTITSKTDYHLALAAEYSRMAGLHIRAAGRAEKQAREDADFRAALSAIWAGGSERDTRRAARKFDNPAGA